MSGERVERRLAAILAADVTGYSRLMGADEAGTLARLKALRRELIDPAVAEHKGRIVKTTGDGLLIEFPSVVEAVACAVAVQQGMAAHNDPVPQDQHVDFRIGINSGDVIVEDGDIHGDGVNIAARLEAIAEPGGICVSGIVHDQVQGRVDCAFDDLGEQQLKNIARPVRVYRIPLFPPGLTRGSAGEGAERPRREAGEVTIAPALPLPDKPSIAVLPFQNMSGDPEQEYFADGMVEEIVTALSRIRWLFVIARNSSFTYKGKAIDVKQVGRELGVRYVPEGSVRKAGNQVRITAQLVEAETAAHLWADRFDGSLEDVFDLQDRVASSVAGVIEPTLRATEMARSAHRPTDDLDTYDLYLRALAQMAPVKKDRTLAALSLADRAIARDRRYAPALALASFCHYRLFINGWLEARDNSQNRAIDFARRALDNGSNDPEVLAYATHVLGHFGEDIGTMIGLIDRALALNPGYARGWFVSGVLRCYAGEADIAIQHTERSMRLSPRERIGAPYWVIGASYFIKRDFEKASSALLSAIQYDPNNAPSYRYLASSYAHMGRMTDARSVIKRLRSISPLVVPTGTALRNPAHRELFLSGLRLAADAAE